ncbi:MAG: DNA repair protein RecO [Candidatus Aminicenantes bacterium]|nr:DNA repair protein RecO [Candidatus Aminicenantes bacterium]
MARKQSEAFVLRSFDIGEQDKIIVLFSRDTGVFKGIAKGARKFGNRFGSSLEPMSLVKVYYYEKEGKDLVTVSNCDLTESFFEIQKDLETSVTCCYFAELIEEFFPSQSKDDTLFRLLQATLQSLRAHADLNFVSAYFEAWFLKLCGILPDFKRCRKCREVITTSSWLSHRKDGIYCKRCLSQGKDEVQHTFSMFLDWTKKNPPPGKNERPFAEQEIEMFRNTMKKILIYHLEKEPKSLSFLTGTKNKGTQISKNKKADLGEQRETAGNNIKRRETYET